MKQYLDVMREILETGHVKEDRTGTGTRSLFAKQMRFNILKDGYPLVTTKKTHLKSITYELLWFLKGSTDNKWLNENGVTIWDEWAEEETGYLGPIYGYQWRSWPCATNPLYPHDQICRIVTQLKQNPDDRRIIVSAWNVDMISDMRLPPCHLLFQFYSHEVTLAERALWLSRTLNSPNAGSVAETVLAASPGGKLEAELDRLRIPRRGLSCQLYQRSCDWFLGVPFNIASYAMLTMMVAQVTNHMPYEFIWTGGDCHLYLNHLDQAHEQLSRDTKPLPWMCLNPEIKDIDDFAYEDFKLIGYESHPHIKAPISV